MNDEHNPQSYVNYLPIETDIEMPPPSKTSRRRVKLSKYWPFAAHLALIAFVSLACLRCLDGRDFYVNSRRPRYREVDGSVAYATSYAPLQSDITTAVSLAASVTRVAGGWWATGFMWRCIFVAMERGGISAKGLSQAISSRPPAPRHFTRKSNMVIIYITLLATFAIDYFSAALTGSFIWEAADRRIPGRIPLAISNGTADYVGEPYLGDSWKPPVLSMASASASIAWMLPSDSVSNITEPSTTFRRVIRGAQYISTNSTLSEVMIPYFAVDAFEWVQDPHQVLTATQISLLEQTSAGEFNPFTTTANDSGGFLPDVQWGEGPQTPISGRQDMPISETRLFALVIYFIPPPDLPHSDVQVCPQNYTIDPGIQINLFGSVNNSFSILPCFGIANVSYRAGVFSGRNCKIISPNVVEAQPPFTLIGNPFTSGALGLTPALVTNLVLSTYAIPLNYGTRRNLAIELTSRAYQAAWASSTDLGRVVFDIATVQIALPTLRAEIIRWRVYLWVALHLWVLALGLLFIYIQSHCDHPWVEDPTMAVFWLDTRAVLTKSDRQLVWDPWRPGTEIPEDGILILEQNEAGQHSVEVKRSSGSRQRRYSDSIPLRYRMPPSNSTTLGAEGRESVDTLIVPNTSLLDSTTIPENSPE
ncbi:uncharacterized protein LACBIDRAFT_333514 [Laccaria bicolor S238N-H82]|uniref:Predicted protein n=1 Tax=Laccaria bicolor (strain S238N-H82 / ATCC MYA-4686) TaxID=486041 RepID=B0DW58_LACBS|nr:uncharacterized protein LACBIDRAFT_333514 [Laccaria bicolor S238N-H82]EDR01126.1 predicted protein [Laccaria bicolor S238N-H82]|eukprot:XP_001888168.1 predicted protein [Laccaria bicolor S238N-H82]